LLREIEEPVRVAELQRDFLGVHELLKRGGADRAAAAILEYVGATGSAGSSSQANGFAKERVP
jgi:hypothetical protein